MKIRNWIISAACLAIVCQPVNSQRVTVSHDATIDFRVYRKYLLLESKNPSSFKICHQAILDNIQIALAIRGLLPVHDGEVPDLFVVYHAGIKEVISIEGYDYRYGSGKQATMATNYSGPQTGTEQPQTLVIDLVDAKRNRLVWRGIATETLVPDNGKVEKKVAAAMQKMFARYPRAER
jgi:uncharacterized protein DUF4136